MQKLLDLFLPHVRCRLRVCLSAVKQLTVYLCTVAACSSGGRDRAVSYCEDVCTTV